MIDCGEIEIENADGGNPFIFQVLCMYHEELSTIYGEKQKTILPSKSNLVIALIGKYKGMLDIDKVCTYAMNWLPFQINEIIPDPWDCGKSEMWIILQDNAERNAQSKNSDAQRLVELGFWYLQGKNGYPEDDKKAFQLFKAAAGQNDPMGLCMVGEMYQYGYGVQRDYDTAAMWYKKSADLNFGRAEFRLGWLYANTNLREYFGNNYVTYSPELAAQYYRRAWQHGYEDSMGIIRHFIETAQL